MNTTLAPAASIPTVLLLPQSIIKELEESRPLFINWLMDINANPHDLVNFVLEELGEWFGNLDIPTVTADGGLEIIFRLVGKTPIDILFGEFSNDLELRKILAFRWQYIFLTKIKVMSQVDTPIVRALCAFGIGLPYYVCSGGHVIGSSGIISLIKGVFIAKAPEEPKNFLAFLDKLSQVLFAYSRVIFKSQRTD